MPFVDSTRNKEQNSADFCGILTVDSAHTKHALEALHPNIQVFRHPDHLPDAQTLQSSFWSSLQNIDLSAKTASNLPEDALKALYGVNDDVVLYWAHHEKLCLIDGRIAFMGGLDLCYGRWDTNQHPIADCHPSNLDEIVFPGQDYNNARFVTRCCQEKSMMKLIVRQHYGFPRCLTLAEQQGRQNEECKNGLVRYIRQLTRSCGTLSSH